MSPTELSSLKWGDDGELSSQDTWNLVNRLTKVEEETKASNLLHLSSKHSHGEHRKKRKPDHSKSA
jgi:hypothetical protein